MNRNYQKELDELISQLEGQKIRPSLYLHSCCAPCSSYVLFYLSKYFDITLFYYNPNIMPKAEYEKRLAEQHRLLEEAYSSIKFVEGEYEQDKFLEMSKNLASEPEGGRRCHKCYELRLGETAKRAKEGGFDYFASTLSISPHKNATILNEIGDHYGQEYGIKHLPSDFKKKEGYKMSIALSKKYDLYRQTYCGCLLNNVVE